MLLCAATSDDLGVLCHGLDIGEGILADDPVRDRHATHEAGELVEREGLRRIVEANGFAQTTESDILAFRHVEATGGREVEHDALLHGEVVATGRGLGVSVFDLPEHVEGNASLRRVGFAGPRTRDNLVNLGGEIADGAGDVGADERAGRNRYNERDPDDADGIFIGATRTADMRNAMLVSLLIYGAAWWLLQW